MSGALPGKRHSPARLLVVCPPEQQHAYRCFLSDYAPLEVATNNDDLRVLRLLKFDAMLLDWQSPRRLRQIAMDRVETPGNCVVVRANQSQRDNNVRAAAEQQFACWQSRSVSVGDAEATIARLLGREMRPLHVAEAVCDEADLLAAA